MKTTIETIAGVNVKGRNFRHELRPLTCIAGGNATGKTAITDAIQIALLGYLPALGKKPGCTIELAPMTAGTMEVEATLTTGDRIRRTFTRTKTGAGAETTGTAPAVAPAQLTFAEFLNAKPTERHAILASLMGQIDYDALGDQTKAKMASLGLLEKVEIKIDRQADRPLDDAIAALADQARQIKQTVDQSRKTLASMAMNAAPPRPTAEDTARADQALATANEAVGKASKVYDDLSDRLQRAPDEPCDPYPTDAEMEAAEKAITDAKSALQTASQRLDDKVATMSKLTALEKSIARIRALAATATGTAPTCTRDQAIQTIADARAELEALASQIQAASTDVGAADQESAMVGRQISQLESGRCPCCGSTGEALESAMQAMRAHQAAAEKQATTASEKVDSLRALKAQQDQILRDAMTTQGQIDAWEAKTRLEEIETEIANLNKDLSQTPDREKLEAAILNAEQNWKALVGRKDEWLAFQRATVPLPEEISAAREALSEAKELRDQIAAELQEIRDGNAAYDAWQADQNRANVLQAETDELETLAKGITELRTFLQEAQRTATAEAMKPLISTTGIFLHGLVAGNMATDQHRVGIQRGDAFLPLEVLSGMEMVAVSAACQAALASRSELKILLVDEMARMVPENRAQFAQNCLEAIRAGVIDQAILIDQSEPESVEGLHTILIA